jgi:hypothetical protein
MKGAGRRIGVVAVGLSAWLLAIAGTAGAAMAMTRVPGAGGSDGPAERVWAVVLSMWQAGVLALVIVGLIAALALTTARARRAEHQLAG